MNSNDNTDLLKIFANDQRMILYRPEWRTFTGSVTSTILLQQILYRWDKNDRKPFYKFKEPCGHDLYRPGDSWTEELGFSRKEFDSALKKIGTKRTKKTEGPTTSIVEYWTDINRITYYNINPGVLQDELDKLYAAPSDPEFTKSPKGDLQVKSKRGFTKNTNGDLPPYKQRLLTENDVRRPVKSDAPPPEPTLVAQEPEKKPSSSFSESELVSLLATLMALVPEQYQKPSVEKTIERGLKSHSEDYIRLAILYTVLHSNGGTWQKFKAYLGNCIDKGWQSGWEPESAQGDTVDKEATRARFRRMSDRDLGILASSGNQWAIEELERRKQSGPD